MRRNLRRRAAAWRLRSDAGRTGRPRTTINSWSIARVADPGAARRSPRPRSTPDLASRPRDRPAALGEDRALDQLAQGVSQGDVRLLNARRGTPRRDQRVVAL